MLQVETQGRSSEEDELNCISPRIIARRRKGRSTNVHTLPDHVRQRLMETFSTVDIEGTGRVQASKVIEIAKQGYLPTPQEVDNVRRYFRLGEGECISCDQMVCAMVRATACMATAQGHNLHGLPFQSLKETFHFEIMQVAREPHLKLGGADGVEACAAAKAILGEEHLMSLQEYYDTLTTSATDGEELRELVRQSCQLPPKRTDQLTTFFDSTKDGMVSTEEFIHRMTLLYGELHHLYQQLRSNTPGTPIMSPAGMGAVAMSPLLSPRLAFDGPVPVANEAHDSMGDIVI